MRKTNKGNVRERERETDRSLATYGLLKFNKEDPDTYILARDVVFGVAVNGNTAMIQHIIDCIFGQGRFTVISHVAQAFNRSSPPGKGVALDVLAIDKEGRRFDLEIQIVKEGDILKRAREYQSHIDYLQLRSGKQSKELKDSYVIFITAFDPFGLGFNLYEEECVLKGTDRLVDHGCHFLYVNALCPEKESPLGDLCEDLFCQDESSIHSPLLKEALQYCRGKEGRKRIGMRMNQTEYEVEQRVNRKKDESFIRNLLKEGGYTDEHIARLVGIPLDEAIKIRLKIESEKN